MSFTKLGPRLRVESILKLEKNSNSNNTIKLAAVAVPNRMKEGKQNLYAAPEDILNRYSDFDIVSAMQEKPQDFLWVRCRAIDSGVSNENGDLFEEEELLKPVFAGTKKGYIPAYKTFEGVPIYTNHENDDIAKAKGKVLYAEWDPHKKCVYCTFFIDTGAYPDIARGIKQGIITDVSMGCLPKGTKVLTSNGYLDIFNIKKGMFVIDESGKSTEVKNLQIGEYTGFLVHLKFEDNDHNFLSGIKLTPDHPVLVINSKENKLTPYYKSACTVSISDELLFPSNCDELSYFSNDNSYFPVKVISIEIEEDYNDLVYNIETESHSFIANGVIVHNCQVDYSRCSICDHKAATEAQYCEHIKNHKARTFSGKVLNGPKKGQTVTNEPVFEKNYGVKFIELSCVSDGAFPDCEIEEIFDVQDVLETAKSLHKAADSMQGIARNVISAENIQDSDDKRNIVIDISNILENIKRYSDTISSFYKESQMPEGPLDATDDINIVPQLNESMNGPMNEPINNAQAPAPAPNQNAQNNTNNINLSQINILDILNQVMELLKMTIEWLLELRSEINMEHVKDAGKIISEVQELMANLIDDGVSQVFGGGGVGVNVPLHSQGRMQPPPTVPRVMPGSQNNQNTEAQGSAYQPTSGNVGVQMGAESIMKTKKIAEQIEKIKEIIGIANHIDIEDNYSTITSASLKEVKRMSRFASQNFEGLKASAPIARHELEDGIYRVVISSNGEIRGFFRNANVGWQPVLSDTHLSQIEEGLIEEVASDLLNQFKESCESGKIKIASISAEVPECQTEVREQNEEAKWPKGRLGFPDYPQENYINDSRKGAAEYPIERFLEDGRTGTDEETKENALKSDNILSRREPADNISEIRLEDLRSGPMDVTTEGRLEQKRAGTASGTKIASAINKALASAVVDARCAPSEVLDAAKELIANSKLVDVLAKYAQLEHVSARARERNSSNFWERNASNINIPISQTLLGTLADEIDGSEIVPNDIVSGLKTIVQLDSERVSEVIGNFAKKIASSINVSSDSFAREAMDGTNRNDEIKKAFLKTIVSEVGEEDLDENCLKASIMAFADTAYDTGATVDELTNIIRNFDRDNLVADVENERTKDAMILRAKKKDRAEFWQVKESSVSYDDEFIISTMAGNMADNASAKDISTGAIVSAVKYLSDKPEATNTLVASALKAKKAHMNKKSWTITDRSEREFSIHFTLSEAGCGSSDTDLEPKIKSYASKLLTEKGYRVAAPDALTFTTLDVCGESVSATIKSSIIRDINGANTSDVVCASDGYIKLRKENRRKEAQGLGGFAPPGDPMAGGDIPGGGAGAGATGAPGESALSFGGGGNPLEDNEDKGPSSPEESMPTPGEIKPPGSICPACGSIDVELAEGHGECQSCGTQFDVSIDVKILNPNQEEKSEDLETEGLGEDITGGPMEEAPVPGAPAVPSAGGMPAGPPPAQTGAPMAESNMKRKIQAGLLPIGVEIKWETSPDIFVRLAANKPIDIIGEKGLSMVAPGTICIACGNRKVERHSSRTYCGSCGILSINSTELSKDKESIVNTTRYML